MIRTGLGYDSHRFAPGDGVMLGGVKVPHDQGFKAHSDGDVVLHALTDALLGALAVGDIGDHFPDTDPKWRGAASSQFVEHAVKLCHDGGYNIVNVDITIMAEAPKLQPHKRTIAEKISAILGVEADCVSVKAKTNESMGFVGRREGIAVLANVLISNEG